MSALDLTLADLRRVAWRHAGNPYEDARERQGRREANARKVTRTDARHLAERRLREMYREDFDRLYAEALAEVGL